MGIDPVGGEKSIQLAVAIARLRAMNIPMSDTGDMARLGRGNHGFSEHALCQVISCGWSEN
jgi:hypothetical protein